jgi:serine/alanine adding enzyme
MSDVIAATMNERALVSVDDPARQPITVTTTASAQEWDRFVEGHRDATGYHRFGWRAVFEGGLGHRCHYLSARSPEGIVGVLPLVEVRSWLFGRALSSLPYVNYGGVLAESPGIAQILANSAAELAAKRRLAFVVLRHRRQMFEALPVRTHKVTMLLPLERDPATMWNRLDRKVRNQVRKAEKSQLTSATGGAELLDEFYGVFAQNMRDLGSPVYGRKLFSHILRNFPSDAHIHVVRLQEQTIAAALSYAYGSTIEVPSASSLKEHRALCPNHLLYWSIVQHAIAQGKRTFDFGRSTPDDGTYHFKAQWGARAEQLWWEYQLIGSTQLPTDDRHSARYQRQIEAWKRLPLGIASWLGPRIARAVP